MAQVQDILTGTIDLENETIAFVCNDFQFTFVRTINENNPVVARVDSNGYIWGWTSDRRKIAIFTKQDLIIYHNKIFGTWNYIVFKKNMCMPEDDGELFDYIRFYNGGIKTINPCGALMIDIDSEQKLEKSDSKNDRFFVYKYRDVSRKIVVKAEEETVSWMFDSVINQTSSFDKGDSLENTTSILDVCFEKKHSLKTFYDYYGYVSTIVSFMTYRGSVGFERITLLSRLSEDAKDEIADCYVKTTDKISKRSFANSISIYNITEESFVEMVYSAMQIDKKHKDLPVEFLPKDNADFGFLTKDRIRHICSALEVELDLADIKATKGDDLELLIDSVKNLVIEKQNDDQVQIPEKTYSSIFGSIRHWGDTVADRTIKAWHRHEDEIGQLLYVLRINLRDEEIEGDIARFIKVRNDITHNGFKEVDENHARTAILLSALIYCMALSRLKVDKETIANFMFRRLVG